ncbi:MAG TPA: FimV/HubP family polar landmark protein, partial [Burkholderiaceae bacterium]|nr:FimV/HubP family polar landmark protein [Burkholderiaceae bacterium]
LQSRPDGTYAVHISSAQAISEPYLDLLLELTWSSGRVLREYTVLLDPPGLRQAPEIVAPVATAQASPVAPAEPVAPAAEAPAAAAQEAPPAVAAAAPTAPGAPAQAAAPSAPEAPAPQSATQEEVAAPGSAAVPQGAPVQAAPAPMEEAQPAPAPAAAPSPATPPPVESAPKTYMVKSGDTLSKIALDNKGRGVSLDQMLLALLQANPKAFIGGNVNRLLAGRQLDMPTADTAIGIDQAVAHREVVAQAADFAAYRSRLAQLAEAAPSAPEKQPTAGAQGHVTTKVEEKGVAPKTGDQLKIAKAEASAEQGAAAAAAGVSKKDEEIARQRAIKEEKDRAAALAKANADIQRANELAAQAAAAAQKQAEAAKAAAAKADALKAEAAKAEAAKAEAAKAEAAKAEAAKAEAARAEAAKLEAAKAEVAKAEAAKADAAKAEAAKAEAAKAAEAAKLAAAAKPETAKKEAPKAAPAPVPAPGLVDSLTSPVVLGSAGGALVVALVGLNVMRRRRTAGSGQLKAEGDLAANSLFGTAGGQSVDTGATSTFNSSFIPAASQLDSNEVDPVAEADVYVAYGREEQAEDILKEALRLQPDRHPVRVKLLEIYSRRGDKASFNAVAQELHDRTGGAGEEWERAAKLGKSLDPTNSLYAGAVAAVDAGARGPTTDLNLGLAAGKAAAGASIEANSDALQFDTLSHMVGDQTKLRAAGTETTRGPETALTPETAMPVDSKLQTPAGAGMAGQRFEPRLPPELPRTAAPAAMPEPQPVARAAAPTPSSIDFGALDFDLGPSKLNLDAQTELPVEKEVEPTPPVHTAVNVVEPPTIPSLDLMFPPTVSVPRPSPPPTVSGTVPIPNLDLNLPGTAVPRPQTAPGSLEEALSRPTLVGAVGAMSDDHVPPMTTNTDQATVPLIDFDLTGADAALTGRRTETQAGSPMASQMATKLDLARGYIDLGVKDGARELLEEVMKDGTREQRQQAVELIKLVEA